MTALSLTEKELDKLFIGQWEITQIDDYLTPKAGSKIKLCVVRSKVNHMKGIITLYSLVPKRNDVYQVVMDGTVGILGKITERTKIDNGTVTRIDSFWLRAIPPDKILSSTNYDISLDCSVIEGKAEMDDVVYNSNEEYTFPVYYFIEEINKTKLLRGMKMDIPIEKFNTYVHMRDLWYRDYQGSSTISYQEN